MKKRKILIFILILLFILSLLIWSAPIFGQTVTPSASPDASIEKLINEGEASAEALGLKEPKLLPTSPFYFLKNWIWSLRQFLTADPFKKTDLDLKMVSEKLLEIRKLADKQPAKVSALERAIGNYQTARERLKTRLESLSADSSNPNLDKLLDRIATAALEHEKLFGDIISKNIPDNLKSEVENLSGQGEQILALTVPRLETKEKAFQRFQNSINGEKGGLLKNFRTLEVVLSMENQLSQLSKEGTSLLEGQLYSEAQSELKNLSQLAKEKLPTVIEFLPGRKIIQEKIVLELEERSGQREFFQKIEEKLRQSQILADDLNKCKEQIGAVEKEIADFKAEIANVKDLSASIASLVQQAEGHIQRAREIFDSSQEGRTVCGLINSASVLVENASRLLAASQPANINSQIEAADKELSDLRAKISAYDQNNYSRLFDLINQAQSQLESTKANHESGNDEQALREFNKFEVIIKNIEKILAVIDNKTAKSESAALGVQKEFFQKEKLEEFDQWCRNQSANLVEDLGILPFCLKGEQKISMSDWWKETKGKTK